MPKNTHPEQVSQMHRDLSAMQQDIAAIKAMLEMHLRAGEHHFEPCPTIKQMQSRIVSALTATILALLTSAGTFIAQIFLR